MHQELSLEPTLGGSAAFPVLNTAYAPSLLLILPLPEEPRGDCPITVASRSSPRQTCDSVRYVRMRPLFKMQKGVMH